MYVIRINKNGDLMSSMPCAECLNAMKSAGIRNVYYSQNQETIVKARVRDMTSHHLSRAQIFQLNIGHDNWFF